MAILAKLYEIAERVWQKMVRTECGSYRASEILKNLYDTILWGDDIDVDEPCSVEVDTFRCTFKLGGIFQFVANFESLAGVGKNARLFTYEEEDRKKLGIVVFQANKAMAELYNFVDAKNALSSLCHIFIDAERNRLVACDGKKMLTMPINILSKAGDTKDMLINARVWKKMCAKMKNGRNYEVKATKLDNHDQATQAVCEDLISYVPYTLPYPNYVACYSKVSDNLCIHIGESWSDIQKFIKTNPADDDKVFLSGKRGKDEITLKMEENEATFHVGKLTHSFNICFARNAMMAASYAETIYMREKPGTPSPVMGKDGNIYLFCGFKFEDAFIGEIENGACCLYGVEFEKDLLQTASEITEKSETKKVVLPKKNHHPATDNSRKFTFEAIGIKPGTIITFAPLGCEVTTTNDNKVEYMGEIYTLSGFCKKFMPANKRNKAESYRGCAFFTYMGVKLEKAFKDVLKRREECKEGEIVTPVEPVTTVEADTSDKAVENVETTVPSELNPKVEIIQVKTFTNDRYQVAIPPAFKVTPFMILDIGDYSKGYREPIPLRWGMDEPTGTYNKAGVVVVPLMGYVAVNNKKPAYLSNVVHELPLPPPLVKSE